MFEKLVFWAVIYFIWTSERSLTNFHLSESHPSHELLKQKFCKLGMAIFFLYLVEILNWPNNGQKSNFLGAVPQLFYYLLTL